MTFLRPLLKWTVECFQFVLPLVVYLFIVYSLGCFGGKKHCQKLSAHILYFNWRANCVSHLKRQYRWECAAVCSTPVAFYPFHFHFPRAVMCHHTVRGTLDICDFCFVSNYRLCIMITRISPMHMWLMLIYWNESAPEAFLKFRLEQGLVISIKKQIHNNPVFLSLAAFGPVRLVVFFSRRLPRSVKWKTFNIWLQVFWWLGSRSHSMLRGHLSAQVIFFNSITTG